VGGIWKKKTLLLRDDCLLQLKKKRKGVKTYCLRFAGKRTIGGKRLFEKDGMGRTGGWLERASLRRSLKGERDTLSIKGGRKKAMKNPRKTPKKRLSYLFNEGEDLSCEEKGGRRATFRAKGEGGDEWEKTQLSKED